VKYEGDMVVITNAADRQMAFVKTKCFGAHVKTAERLLSEISRARICLSDDQQKIAYDNQLRSSDRLPPVIGNQYDEVLHTALEVDPVVPASQVPRRGAKRPVTRSKGKAYLIGHLLAPVLGIGLGLLFLYYYNKHQEDEITLDDAASENTANLFDDNEVKTLQHPGNHSPGKPSVEFRVEISKADPEDASLLQGSPTSRDSDPPDDTPGRAAINHKNSDPLPPDRNAEEKPSEVIPNRPSAIIISPKNDQPDVGSVPAAPDPAENRDPFDDFKQRINLPDITSTRPVSLGMIYVPKDLQLKLELLAAPLAAAKDKFFKLVRDEVTTGALPAWTVVLKDSAYIRSDAPQVARLTLEDASLNFQWQHAAIEVPGAELCNCALEAIVGDQRRIMALRAPQQLPPLSAAESIVRLNIDIPNCPPLKNADGDALVYLMLHVVPQEGVFATQALNEKVAAKRPLRWMKDNGDKAKVDFSWELEPDANRKNMLLKQELSFRVYGKSDMPFDLDRINRFEASTQKAIASTIAEGNKTAGQIQPLGSQIATQQRATTSVAKA
ncbi:MAG: hypothetical protein N2C12_06485, partial [Planctomycetales bacterium]